MKLEEKLELVFKEFEFLCGDVNQHYLVVF
jgi:hypothetical protein